MNTPPTDATHAPAHAAEAFANLPPPGEVPTSARRGERTTAHDSSILAGILDPVERRAWALEPTTPDELWQLCCDVAEAKVHGVQSPEDALARVMIGRPLGLPAMASIQGIAMIWNENAKPKPTNITVMYAKTKLGLLLSRTDKIAYIRPKKDAPQDAKSATWCGKRTGTYDEEQEETFTIEDAITAGLVDRGGDAKGKAGNNYNKHPKPMLKWRAVGRLCDTLGADILTGIATREEVEDQIEDERARQAAADEVLAKLPTKTLEQTILDRKGASAPDPHVAEAERFKARVTESIATKKGAKALRADFDTWRKTAPAALVEDVLAHWNVEASIAAPVVHQGTPAAAAKEEPEPKKEEPRQGGRAAEPTPAATPEKKCEACGEPMKDGACGACGWVLGQRIPE